MVDGRFTIAGPGSFTRPGLNGPMRTGKLSISRGYQFGESAAAMPRLVLVPRSDDRPPPKPARAASAAAPAPAPPVCEEYRPAHDRLAALERLARLHKQNMLSAEEFAAEKARILNPLGDELVLRETGLPEPLAANRPLLPHRGPSLLGRLMSWKFVPVGLAAGIGLSFASQPQETMRFFDEALRLLGV